MTEHTHWGPDPGHGGLTQHKGLRADCSGPDCGSDEGSHFHQATQRLEASDWQWQEGKPKGAMREAVVAQVHSNLAVAFELRRMNEDRSQWYREVLEVLTQAKNPPASKGFGYYAEDPSEMCTARSHPDRRAWHRCLRMAEHEGLHEDGMGNAFSKDYPAAAPSQQEGEDGER